MSTASNARLFVLLCSSGLVAGLLVTGRRRGARHSAPALCAADPAGAGTAESPRVARDAAWAAAVTQAWRSDEDINASLQRGDSHHRRPLTYRDQDGEPYYGELFWAEPSATPDASHAARPGVVLVHTAVGPRDLMLSWRAQSLAALGYVVLVADLLGDETGAAWEAEWAAPRRAPLVEDRDLSRRRMRLALDTLCAPESNGVPAAPKVDAARLAALGYCFGGRCVLDLARAGAAAGVRGVVSFHGVLDDAPLAAACRRGARTPG